MPFRILIACLIVASASAEPPPRLSRIQVEMVERLARAAREELEASRYDRALSLFQRAHSISGQVVLLANIGRCYDKMGQSDMARDVYQRVLASSPSKDIAAKVQGWLEALPVVDPPLRFGHVAFFGRADVEVWLDGRPVGVTPMAKLLAVPEGQRRFTLTPRDAEPVTHVVAVTHGEVAQVDLTVLFPAPTHGELVLANTNDALRIRIDGVAVDNSGRYVLSAGHHLLSAESPSGELVTRGFEITAGRALGLTLSFAEDEPDRIGVGPWVLGGVGVASLVTGVVFTVLANDRYADYEDDPAKPDSLLSETETLDIVAYSLYGVGAALIISGVTWGAINYSASDDAANGLESGGPSAVGGVSIVPGGFLIGVGGAF
jgi:hypothetical protein